MRRGQAAQFAVEVSARLVALQELGGFVAHRDRLALFREVPAFQKRCTEAVDFLILVDLLVGGFGGCDVDEHHSAERTIATTVGLGKRDFQRANRAFDGLDIVKLFEDVFDVSGLGLGHQGMYQKWLYDMVRS